MKLSKGLWRLLILGTLGVCVLTVTGFLGEYWWAFDLTADFRVQYLPCLGFAALLFVVRKKWVWAMVAVAFAVVNSVDIFPAFIGTGSRAAPSSSSVTLLLANVLSSNQQYDEVKEVIHRADPDIIVVIEATEEWMKKLASVEEEYPHKISRTREDNFGISVLSRIAFEESEILAFGGTCVPTAVARFRMDDRELTLLATHPLPPVRGLSFRYRNRHLDEVAEYVKSLQGPVILCGDLNTTPWSAHFKKLLRTAGLRDSRRGRGIQGTWPAGTWPGLLRMPLDHVLHSPEVAILDREIGPDIGSDRLPVIVEFCWAERP